MEFYLTFFVGKEFFAVNVAKVLEVQLIQNITKIPKTPKHIKGIINFRGEIVPVVDMLTKLDIAKIDDKQIIIVFEILDEEGSKIHIAATSTGVKDVIEIAPSEIKPVPELGLRYNNDYISGAIKRDDKFILMLAIDKVFSEEEFDKISSLEIKPSEISENNN